MTSSWGIFRQVNSYLVLSGGAWWCFFMLLDETREPSWETEGTFYSIVGVGHLYVLTTSLACCSIFVSIGLKERHDIWGPSSSLFSPPLKLRWRWPWQLVGRSISGFTLSPQHSSLSPHGWFMFFLTLSQRFSFLLPPTSYPARTALLVTVFLCQVIF